MPIVGSMSLFRSCLTLLRGSSFSLSRIGGIVHPYKEKGNLAGLIYCNSVGTMMLESCSYHVQTYHDIVEIMVDKGAVFSSIIILTMVIRIIFQLEYKYNGINNRGVEFTSNS
jgi:hypothetical protein